MKEARRVPSMEVLQLSDVPGAPPPADCDCDCAGDCDCDYQAAIYPFMELGISLGLNYQFTYLMNSYLNCLRSCDLRWGQDT